MCDGFEGTLSGYINKEVKRGKRKKEKKSRPQLIFTCLATYLNAFLCTYVFLPVRKIEAKQDLLVASLFPHKCF